MSTRQWTRMALVLGLAMAGCAPAAKDGSRRGQAPQPLVVVANRNFSDMNVMVVQSGARVRLGTMTGLSTRRFRLPRGVRGTSAEIRIVADHIGGTQTYQSPPVRMLPGQSLELTIGSSLPLSSVAV